MKKDSQTIWKIIFPLNNQSHLTLTLFKIRFMEHIVKLIHDLKAPIYNFLQVYPLSKRTKDLTSLVLHEKKGFIKINVSVITYT